MKFNVNSFESLIKNFNNTISNSYATTVTPHSMLHPTAAAPVKIKQEKLTQKQIIDEFDPINREKSLEEENSVKHATVNFAPLLPNNFTNLTPRPFTQTSAPTISSKQTMSPPKPNYNVNLPLVNSSLMFRHPQINYNNNLAMSTSQSFTSNSTASPYVALNYSNNAPAYRPVNFTAPSVGNNLNFTPRSNSTDFSNINNNQSNKTN